MLSTIAWFYAQALFAIMFSICSVLLASERLIVGDTRKGVALIGFFALTGFLAGLL